MTSNNALEEYVEHIARDHLKVIPSSDFLTTFLQNYKSNQWKTRCLLLEALNEVPFWVVLLYLFEKKTKNQPLLGSTSIPIKQAVLNKQHDSLQLGSAVTQRGQPWRWPV